MMPKLQTNGFGSLTSVTNINPFIEEQKTRNLMNARDALHNHTSESIQMYPQTFDDSRITLEEDEGEVISINKNTVNHRLDVEEFELPAPVQERPQNKFFTEI